MLITQTETTSTHLPEGPIVNIFKTTKLATAIALLGTVSLNAWAVTSVQPTTDTVCGAYCNLNPNDYIVGASIYILDPTQPLVIQQVAGYHADSIKAYIYFGDANGNILSGGTQILNDYTLNQKFTINPSTFAGATNVYFKLVNTSQNQTFWSDARLSGDSQSHAAVNFDLLNNSTPGAYIGMEDRWNADWDFNDYVFTLSNVSPTLVPEPETYAMLLAGLGIIGAVARRRRAQI
ncbi:MAG: PEP-CTERM sorting domain-containing protein [Azoarcus sp.]|jgi:hypothetical protein|nr:PEP-CTERM sorting domain-containing protein [Azoarcus sp.]